MRIGMLGGTFNPVHIGHLILAQECWHRFDLDKVFFIPAFIPPHKQIDFNVSAEDRLNMVNISAPPLSWAWRELMNEAVYVGRS